MLIIMYLFFEFWRYLKSQNKQRYTLDCSLLYYIFPVLSWSCNNRVDNWQKLVWTEYVFRLSEFRENTTEDATFLFSLFLFWHFLRVLFSNCDSLPVMKSQIILSFTLIRNKATRCFRLLFHQIKSQSRDSIKFCLAVK